MLFKNKKSFWSLIMEKDKKDVGFIQDFIFYLQNAIALEHHLIESYSVTKDKIQMDMAERIRRNRSKWMYRFIKESKNQIYCESKHLMAMAQSMKELGNRYIEQEERELADECFQESADCEACFILLNKENGGKE
jgi:DNA polymerase III gamma/tau subunit